MPRGSAAYDILRGGGCRKTPLALKAVGDCGSVTVDLTHTQKRRQNEGLQGQRPQGPTVTPAATHHSIEVVVTLASRWVEFSCQSTLVEPLSCVLPTTVAAVAKWQTARCGWNKVTVRLGVVLGLPPNQ